MGNAGLERVKDIFQLEETVNATFQSFAHVS
jgi:hypothetical protein